MSQLPAQIGYVEFPPFISDQISHQTIDTGDILAGNCHCIAYASDHGHRAPISPDSMPSGRGMVRALAYAAAGTATTPA